MKTSTMPTPYLEGPASFDSKRFKALFEAERLQESEGLGQHVNNLGGKTGKTRDRVRFQGLQTLTSRLVGYRRDQ